MRIIMFYHSLRSCWNHGNAHFLRGVVAELMARGHDVVVYEPRLGWSVQNLLSAHGQAPLDEFAREFPGMASVPYDLGSLDLDEALDHADLVVVHEWNEPALVARVGAHRARTRSYRLLFHDTHHRALTAPERLAGYDLREYDAVLAFGQVLRDIYIERGWAERAYTWHEAADVRRFRPLPGAGAAGADTPRAPDSLVSRDSKDGDLVWIGNWGDGERSAELVELLLEPACALGLQTRIHGVRYPADVLRRLAGAGIEHGGWLPNHRVPELFARYRATVHVPRQPYSRALPGIPTIRVFEALACGIPLITGPWEDSEGLFSPGDDYLVARTGAEMKRGLAAVLSDPELARSLVSHGLATIMARHTCGHRVSELLAIAGAIATPPVATTARQPADEADAMARHRTSTAA